MFIDSGPVVHMKASRAPPPRPYLPHSWSIMLAFGSALGGFAAARWGLYACFLIDALTFLLSAVFTCMLLFMPNRGSLVGAASPRAPEDHPPGGGGAAVEEAEAPATELKRLLPPANGASHAASDAAEEATEEGRPSSAAAAGPSPRCCGAGAAVAAAEEKGESGFRSIVEGYKYIFAAENREILAYISIKGTGGEESNKKGGLSISGPPLLTPGHCADWNGWPWSRLRP